MLVMNSAKSLHGHDESVIEVLRAQTNDLLAELRQVFNDPRYVVKVHFSTNLGCCASVLIHDSNPSHGIWHNSPVSIHLMAHLNAKDLPKLAWESLGSGRVTLRKLSSTKGNADLNSKLVAKLKAIKPQLDTILETKEAQGYLRVKL